jgi:hypothetical protein
MFGAAAVALAVGPAAFGQDCTTCGHPPTNHCPPKFWHWEEGPPRLKYKHACPKPVCDPCSLPHAGYYQTCWNPWPWAPDWSHCVLPPSAGLVEDVPSDAVVPLYTPRDPAAAPPTTTPPTTAPPTTNPVSRPTPPPPAPLPTQRMIEARPVSR